MWHLCSRQLTKCLRAETSLRVDLHVLPLSFWGQYRPFFLKKIMYWFTQWFISIMDVTSNWQTFVEDYTFSRNSFNKEETSMNMKSVDLKLFLVLTLWMCRVWTSTPYIWCITNLIFPILWPENLNTEKYEWKTWKHYKSSSYIIL